MKNFSMTPSSNNFLFSYNRVCKLWRSVLHPILLKRYGQPLIEGNYLVDRKSLDSLNARKQALEAVSERKQHDEPPSSSVRTNTRTVCEHSSIHACTCIKICNFFPLFHTLQNGFSPFFEQFHT